jgi:hypothetical protein
MRSGDGADGQDSSLVPRDFSRRHPAAPGVSQRVFDAGTQLLAEEPVKSSTALANASGFSSGMK